MDCLCNPCPPRSALEHGRRCPLRIYFYGGKPEWDRTKTYVVVYGLSDSRRGASVWRFSSLWIREFVELGDAERLHANDPQNVRYLEEL